MKGLPELAPNQAPRKSTNATPELRILVIDDDPLYGEIVEQVANQQNVKVHRILPSELDTLKGSFDAAIIDFDLGETDGAELSEQLEKHLGVIPTVLVSAIHREDLPRRKWPKSIIGFVPKAAGHMEAVMSAINLCQAKVATLLKGKAA